MQRDFATEDTEEVPVFAGMTHGEEVSVFASVTIRKLLAARGS